MDKREIELLDEQARKAIIAHHNAQARKFIECAANLAATTMPLKDVARLLREIADMIDELG